MFSFNKTYQFPFKYIIPNYIEVHIKTITGKVLIVKGKLKTINFIKFAKYLYKPQECAGLSLLIIRR